MLSSSHWEDRAGLIEFHQEFHGFFLGLLIFRLAGGLFKPRCGFCHVSVRARADIVHVAASELGLGVALFRGLFKPVQCPGVIQFCALAGVVHVAAVELGVGMTEFRSLFKQGQCLGMVSGIISGDTLIILRFN